MVLPEYAERGIASLAAAATRCARERNGSTGSLMPFHQCRMASNAVCGKAGFVNLGECTFEYPKGHFMKV